MESAKQNRSNRLDYVTCAAGVLSAFLGLAVMAGWLANNQTLIRVFPALEPMRFNTAIGFFLSGAGLIAAQFRARKTSIVCGAAVGALGLLTLFQYLAGADLGIDNLFVRDAVSSSYPGRMAPPTALGFSLAGAALLAKRPAWLSDVSTAAGLFGSIIVSIGATALSGYFTGVTALSAWGDFISMALHTGAGFVVLGSGVIAFAWQGGKDGQRVSMKWLPVIIGVSLFTGALVLWRLVAAQERTHIERAVMFKTTQVSYDIQDQMEHRIKGLLRMARRWELQGRPLKKDWGADAALYLNHYTGFQAIAWADAWGRALWVARSDTDASGPDGSLDSEERGRGELWAARKNREVRISRLVRPASIDGGGVFMAYVPVFRTDEFEGFIVGVFKARELFDGILLHEAGGEYSIAISNEDGEIYKNHEAAGPDAGNWAQDARVRIYGADWRVRVWPRKGFLAGLQSPLPGVILATGLLMSLLLSLVVYLSQTAQRRAKAAEAAKRELESEVAERKMAEEKAERHSMALAMSNIELEREVAERKKAEETARRQAQELKRSNAELEQFAYVASHDLQEPLRMVASYVQLLERRYRGKLDDKANTFISYAVDGAARMQRLINDLLAYSRVGSGAREFAPVDCAQVLKRTLASLKSLIEESAAAVTSGPLPVFPADEAQMEHLFMNLIGNAIKYRREHAPAVHVSAAQRDGEWIISVRDNGIGIDPRYHERIFVIFQRLHGKDEYSGTGIGLAICKKVVENHGGRIWVESDPGAGSTFHFTIPIREVI